MSLIVVYHAQFEISTKGSLHATMLKAGDSLKSGLFNPILNIMVTKMIFLANWYEIKPSVAHSRTSFTLNSELYLVIKSAPQLLDLCLTIMGYFYD